MLASWFNSNYPPRRRCLADPIYNCFVAVMWSRWNVKLFSKFVLECLILEALLPHLCPRLQHSDPFNSSIDTASPCLQWNTHNWNRPSFDFEHSWQSCHHQTAQFPGTCEPERPPALHSQGPSLMFVIYTSLSWPFFQCLWEISVSLLCCYCG